MFQNKRILAVIPARGGSKGLKRKNIRIMAGKPLVAWSIEEAKKSNYVDKVLLSTDDEEIASLGAQYGAWVPFLRPKNLSTDSANSVDVLLHALDYANKNQGCLFDIVVLIEPTSPLREASDIDVAIEKLCDQPGAESVVSFCEAEAFNPAFLYTLSRDNYICPYNSQFRGHIRRQDLSKVFFPEGTVYVSWTDSLLKRQSFYHEKTLAYIVPKWKSIEIDELSDFISAEALLNYKINGGSFIQTEEK